MSEYQLVLPPAWINPAKPVRIALVGTGGNGGEFGDRLGKLATVLRAIGSAGLDVTAFDGDHVSPSNIGRQRFASCDIGANKAVLLVHRLNAFYAQTWSAIPRHATASELIRGDFDLIITCVDSARFRTELGQQKPYQRVWWCDLGNGDLAGNVVLGHLDDGKSPETHIPNVFELFPQLQHLHAADEETPSCSTEEAVRRQALPINSQCVDLAFQLLWFLFRQQRLSHHGFQFRLNPLQVTPIACDPLTWALYGYVVNDVIADTPTKARRGGRRKAA